MNKKTDIFTITVKVDGRIRQLSGEYASVMETVTRLEEAHDVVIITSSCRQIGGFEGH